MPLAFTQATVAATKRFRKLLVLVIVVFAIFEVTSTIAAVWTLMSHHGVPGNVAVHRLVLAKWFVSPFLSVDPRVKPYLGGRQRYVELLTDETPRWIDLFVPDAFLSERIGRNITAFDGNVYVTNDEGFTSLGDRDFHYGQAHPDQRYRIIVVGGSTVFGWGAGEPSNSLPARLNSSLKRYARDRYEIINAGVPAYDSAQEFLYIISELIHYKPDLLVVYDGWNDEVMAERDSSQPPWQDDLTNTFKNSDHLAIEKRFVASYSVFGSSQLLAGNIVARGRAQIHHTGTYWFMNAVINHVGQHFPFRQQRSRLTYDPGRVARYQENLTNTLNFAEQNGVRVALFLQPVMWIDGRVPTPAEARVAAKDVETIAIRRAFYSGARTTFALLRNRRQQSGRACIEDVSQILKDTTETIYVDSGHLLERGNQIVADEIAKHLANCGVLSN